MQLNDLDWWVILVFFLLMVVIGIWSSFKNRDSQDFFIAGGKLPWWLSGISHHVSGYSGAVFVAYAGLAYTHGFSIYVWWAFTIGFSMLLTIKLFPIRWVRLRLKYNIQSPLEYLKTRYDLPTQQIMAWSGVLLKLFDVAAKWAAIAILLNVFTGASITTGVFLAGGVSLIYITLGGLWAVILTDFTQFLVQVAAGIVMFVAVVAKLGGWSSITGLWEQLPEKNSHLFNEPYTIGFALAFLFINTLSYNGGTWNLATRYISSSNETQVRKAAVLSGVLYLLWPLILFFPMWAAPVILPHLENPTESYGMLTLNLLPPGLIGLVLASMFANTMSMTSSDANTISAVITRDILPALSTRFNHQDQKRSLKIARVCTFVFTSATILIALQYEHFGGVLGLIVTWFGALLGPVSIPMLLGLLPPFKNCGPRTAIISIAAGFIAFAITKFFIHVPLALEISLPLLVSAGVYFTGGFLNRNKPVPGSVENLINSIRTGTNQ